MTQLSAMFSLLALIFYLVGRSRINQGKRYSFVYMVIALVPILACAVLSKENGVLVLFQVLLLESLFFDDESRTRQFKKFFLLFVIGPVVFF